MLACTSCLQYLHTLLIGTAVRIYQTSSEILATPLDWGGRHCMHRNEVRSKGGCIIVHEL
jgi:hypothetical protein